MKSSAHSVDEQHTCISCIGQGLLSISQVPELYKLSTLRSLCLHGNNITRIEGLQNLIQLVDLNLSSNALNSIDPGSLKGLCRLTSLNLASNRLQAVQGLDGLLELQHLNVSYNYITNIGGLSALQGPLCKLRQVNLKENQLLNLQAFSVFVGCISLRSLHIAGNPVCQLPNYMQALITVLPQLAQLDSLKSGEVLEAPYDVHAAQHYAVMRLQSFELLPLAASTAQPMSSPPYPYGRQPHVSGAVRDRAVATTSVQSQTPAWQSQSAGDAVARSGRPHGRQDPHEAVRPAELQSVSQGQDLVPVQQAARGLANCDTEMSSLAVGQPQPHSVRRPPANWQARVPGGVWNEEESSGAEVFTEAMPQRPVERKAQKATDVLPTSDQGQPMSAEPQPQHQVAVKVLLTDAAVQTSEYTPLVRRLQAEAAEMRQQLTALTDELARRNATEEALRVSMQDAVAAAQEDAHRKVEDGFREASFAVSKALQELELSRHAAAEAQQRVAVHARAQEEQRMRCSVLEKDLARLHDDMQRMNQQLLDQQHTAAATLEEERRRAAAVEAATREQLAVAQSVAAELPVVRAALAAAEQKMGSLEGALQQSSSVAVSMTAQIAQTMADANAQIDVLKARLATAEQQLAEHQRREVDTRAEINTLTAALQAARTQQARELEAAARQHDESLKAAVEKERSAAEERGKAVAALQAQQERTGLQEQIAFLKVQLQFALKESDKEQVAAMQALRAAQSEVSELRATLQASTAKQREGEALVSDLTSVVQQQKAAIQALQREKEALAARLKACGPEAYDALVAENVQLKRTATERDMYREQMDDARRRWQEAERRVTELQVSSSRNTEELSAKLRASESTLAAAREEAYRAEATAEKLRQEVAAQQDVVKIKVAMLDSANDTISSLKAEIADLQVEADEARRAAEEAEAALAREQQQHDDDDDKAQLRQEVQTAESAATTARSAMLEAQARLKEVEGRLRAATEAVAEKDSMIKYVEEEVDRVKGLFEKREQRLREERDAARTDAAAAGTAREVAEERLAEANIRAERLSRELDHVRGQLEDAALQVEEQRRAVAQAEEAASSRAAEARRLAVRVTEVEGEMRQLLEAVERQKASSAHKMRQLASLLQDL